MLEIWNFLSGISDEGTLVVVLWLAYKVGGIEKQLNNHLPTQINDLKANVSKLEDNQKEMRKEIREDQKEIKGEIKDQNHKIDQCNQKIDQNYKDLTAQNNKILEKLSSLVAKG